MYLRASTTELEANGESAEGCAKSMSDLRAKIKALTDGAVDIMGDNETYKSTYQILKEISEVYNSMSDINQASLLELIAGKRNANAVSAVLKQFSIAESSLESAQDAAGSAMAENEKYLDSIQGRVAQLDASFQKLSNDVLDSGIVKFIVSFGTGITDAADGLVNLTGALPLLLGSLSGIFSAGRPKMTGFILCPPILWWRHGTSWYLLLAREYLAKPTNMVWLQAASLDNSCSGMAAA